MDKAELDKLVHERSLKEQAPEEAYTCECDSNNQWTIFAFEIRCGVCGRRYSAMQSDDPEVFNRYRAEILEGHEGMVDTKDDQWGKEVTTPEPEEE